MLRVHHLTFPCIQCRAAPSQVSASARNMDFTPHRLVVCMHACKRRRRTCVCACVRSVRLGIGGKHGWHSFCLRAHQPLHTCVKPGDLAVVLALPWHARASRCTHRSACIIRDQCRNFEAQTRSGRDLARENRKNAMLK